MSAATKLIRGVAIYDIVATAGLAVPGLSALTLGLFRQLHLSLGLAGDFPEFGPMHHTFAARRARNTTEPKGFPWLRFSRCR